MTETSFPWPSTITGDASAAPYDHLEFSRFFGKILASDAAGFVIPAYANNLTVQASSPAAASVDVATGAAYVKGFFYENDALNTLAIAANASGNPRLDRIVLRVNFAAQTVRLAVLQGTAAATPALPALTQTYGTTWEISLAYVWVANGFVTITAVEIHDERIFSATFDASPTLLHENMIHNSEFMAFGRLNTIVDTAPGAPDHWTVEGTVTTWASATKPAVMSRGRYVEITAGGANAGMSQLLRAKGSTTYAFKVVTNVTAGDIGIISITDNGGTPATITRNIRRTGVDVEELIYYTTPSDATTITVKLIVNAGTDIVKYGQAILVEGFIAGPFRQIHEMIILDFFIRDTNWMNDTKSDGTTSIDLDTDYQALVLPGTRAVCLNLVILDSGSAGGVLVVLAARSKGTVMSGAYVPSHLTTNGSVQAGTGWVPLDVNNQFDLFVEASGVNTATVIAEIIGIQT